MLLFNRWRRRAPRRHAIGRRAERPAGVLFRRMAGPGGDGAGTGAVRSREVGDVERREQRSRRAQHPIATAPRIGARRVANATQRLRRSQG
jgi:hypothetical protein